jgi:hypothetical protein
MHKIQLRVCSRPCIYRASIQEEMVRALQIDSTATLAGVGHPSYASRRQSSYQMLDPWPSTYPRGKHVRDRRYADSCGVTNDAKQGSGSGARTRARLFLILFGTYLFRPPQTAGIAKGFRPLWALRGNGHSQTGEIKTSANRRTLRHSGESVRPHVTQTYCSAVCTLRIWDIDQPRTPIRFMSVRTLFLLVASSL